jgi:hypothetical protein
MRRSLTAHRAASKCAGIPGIPERAGISGTRRRCSFVLAGTPVVSWSRLPGEFLRNRSVLRQQAGVGKRLYMVKLYHHSGRLAVLGSRSNGVSGSQGSAYGLPSAASGPPPGSVVQTNPIPGGRDTPALHYSIIPPFQPDADYAKQSQFSPERGGTRPRGRETIVRNKPNWANRDGSWGTWGQSCDIASIPRFGKQSQFARSGRKDHRQGQRPWRCHPSGGGCAKQTQFPAHKISQHSTVQSFQYSNPMQMVRNEPNFGGHAPPDAGPNPRRSTQGINC